MLSRIAAAAVPVLGRLTVTCEQRTAPGPGTLIVANHTSLVDPGVVLAALRGIGVEPVVLATAGLWRIPVLGRLLDRDGHIPVHRRTARAADALEAARTALTEGRCVLVYGEGRIPPRLDAGEAAPEPFRTGPARLAAATGAQVVPLGQAGARRISSGSGAKQLAGFLTAPVRRPRVHVHLGAPVRLPATLPDATAAMHRAVTAAWRSAADQLGEPVALAS
ncbi:lysophospholipid acyltransferase family protein [Streptomyces clavuligerus]|uniref:Putative acyltransferase n=1 Tax=Streptomyces clavuligerus TaxID=1901 RepID=D5SK66_STRCL|nr:lysophospholipid acyltransferase family protein [Streptomyces clavuligerus]ANW22242.1 acyltransferase [Streptomyces clavuligerus]AXU17138.1 1-acyl-sn-glycerol-3-phosphate acyltransferase [Streptomyces clavuligerus]EFG04309.1 Putative acyltransferase [Streptomyces clavuligerus]MBY6307216.1 1-acyl-sn-glycerol-3-phosphate acyltransferase [Streptomyces clavuligerus]QCS10206.1 1-acyl-sn-glycerol-3-phosphate acyltransferase [Streptomyces clavuligerus]